MLLSKREIDLIEKKLCKDCIHSEKLSLFTLFFRYIKDQYRDPYNCFHPEAVHDINPYNGRKIYRCCSSMREERKPCGIEGKLFEQT